MSKSKGRCVSAEEMVATSVAGVVTKENAPFEQKWRNDAEEIRSQIERTQDSIATLEAAVADEGRSASDRKAAEKTLAGARQALAGFERQWEEARDGGRQPARPAQVDRAHSDADEESAAAITRPLQ